MASRQLRVGLIGAGYIGNSHAIALLAMPTVFATGVEVIAEMIAEVSDALAARKAKELCFRRSTGDWRELVEDPDVDVVDICAPNFLHKEMALAAIAAADRRGFRTILIGPEHPDYAAFCPAPGHGLGYNDQKIIEDCGG